MHILYNIVRTFHIKFIYIKISIKRKIFINFFFLKKKKKKKKEKKKILKNLKKKL